MDRLRNAFGFIEGMKEGEAFDRELQEQRRLERIAEREAKEKERM
jgi:serine/arginine repetitive matrix protein 2